jgi:MFS family permease
LTAFFGIFGLYALQKFNAGPEAVGVIMMVFGLVTALAQGLMTGPLTQRLGEPAVIQGTLAATAAGFLAIALSSTFTTFLLAIGLFTLATALLAPTVSAMTSQVTTFDLYLEYPNYLGAVVMFVGFIISIFTISGRNIKVVETFDPR